jgi:hypothetical protein
VLDAAVRERAAYLRETETLVLADLHVGRAEASDVAFPLGERSDLVDRLRALLAAFSPAEVVFAGDVLHRFDRASVAAAETVAALVDACREAGARPVAVEGNHDRALASAWDGDVHDAYRLADGTVVCHGHAVPAVLDPSAPGASDGADGDEASGSASASGSTSGRPPLVVCGHDHPAITVEGRRRPCHLYGPGTDHADALLMLPAFTRLAAGADVAGMYSRDFQSPLVADADTLRPVVRAADGDETLPFPPLGELRRML